MTGVQWVVDAYTVVLAALLVSAGALSDRLGARSVFLTGLALFIAASAACGLSPTTRALVAARAAQGVGAALSVPSSLALLQTTHPDPAAQARAIGIWGASPPDPVRSSAGRSSPGRDGAASSSSTCPSASPGVLMVPIWVVGSARRRRSVDVPGQLAIVVCLGSLTAGLIEGGHSGWTSPPVLVELAVGVAAGGALTVVESRTAVPLLPLSLFRSPTFSAGNAGGLLINLGFYGELFMLTFYLQQLRGWRWSAPSSPD